MGKLSVEEKESKKDKIIEENSNKEKFDEINSLLDEL